MLQAMESRAGLDDLAVEETAIGVIDAILAAAAPRGSAADIDSKPAHRDLAEGTREFLGREFRKPLRLQAIAEHARVTPAHLCRVFRRMTGWSIHRYVTQLRLRAALEPLAGGERDLSGLAFDLGFSSHSHFTHAFRREFGATPSAWRGSRRPRARFR
jgi:AraC family transcriptional regulator